MNNQTKNKLKITENIFKAVTIFLLFLIIGVCLDNWVKTKPLFMILFFLISLVSFVIFLKKIKNK